MTQMWRAIKRIIAKAKIHSAGNGFTANNFLIA